MENYNTKLKKKKKKISFHARFMCDEANIYVMTHTIIIHKCMDLQIYLRYTQTIE